MSCADLAVMFSHSHNNNINSHASDSHHHHHVTSHSDSQNGHQGSIHAHFGQQDYQQQQQGYSGVSDYQLKGGVSEDTESAVGGASCLSPASSYGSSVKREVRSQTSKAFKNHLNIDLI